MADQLPVPLPPPDPFVPPEVDLRGMEFIPLKGDVLFKSTTWVKGSHEARCAALRLWWHSFAHEVPAASLPDDDHLLADYAGYGEVVKAWLKIKPQAMRGWVKCSDGRWYHKTVAELALEAWQGRVRNRNKVRDWRAKKASSNSGGNGNSGSDVTVTKPVRNRLESEGQLQGEGQLQEEVPSAAAAPVAARASTPGDDEGDQETPSAAEQAVDPPKKPGDQLSIPPHLDRRIDQAFAIWNARAVEHGWPQAQLLNSTRRWSIQQRLGECGGIGGWRAALDAAEASKFIIGTNGEPQRWFDLDWLLKAENFTRLMEGRYAERHRNDNRGDERSVTAALAGLSEELSR